MDKINAVPMDVYNSAMTYFKCKKCIAAVFIGAGGLYYAGALSGANVAQPATLLKPIGVLIGAQIAAEFLFTEASHFGYKLD